MSFVIETMEQILTATSEGLTVIKEYEETGSLKDSTRRLMVNISFLTWVKKKGKKLYNNDMTSSFVYEARIL